MRVELSPNSRDLGVFDVLLGCENDRTGAVHSKMKTIFWIWLEHGKSIPNWLRTCNDMIYQGNDILGEASRGITLLF